MLFAVDSWIETETPAVAMAALVAIARHGDRTLQPEFATSEERPVPKAAPDSPSPEFADPAASDHPAPGASDFKRVSDARAETIVAEKDTSRPSAAARQIARRRHAERRVKSKVAGRNSYGRIRVVENIPRASTDPFDLFGSR